MWNGSTNRVRRYGVRFAAVPHKLRGAGATPRQGVAGWGGSRLTQHLRRARSRCMAPCRAARGKARDRGRHRTLKLMGLGGSSGCRGAGAQAARRGENSVQGTGSVVLIPVPRARAHPSAPSQARAAPWLERAPLSAQPVSGEGTPLSRARRRYVATPSPSPPPPPPAPAAPVDWRVCLAARPLLSGEGQGLGARLGAPSRGGADACPRRRHERAEQQCGRRACRPRVRGACRKR